MLVEAAEVVGRLLRAVVWALCGPRWLPLWVQVVGLHGGLRIG